MSYIYGIWNISGQAISQEIIDAYRQVYTSTKIDYRKHWLNSDRTILLGCEHIENTKASHFELLPYTEVHSGCTITSSARLDNRDELIRLLNIPSQNNHDSLIILTCYLKYGQKCLNYLRGDYFFAIWDSRHQSMFMARDQIGIEPGYYYHDSGLFVFASSLPGIIHNKEVPREINIEWLTHLMTGSQPTNAKTGYKHIFTIQPAHKLIVSQRKLENLQYFSFDGESEINYKSEQDYTEAFLERYQKAVNVRINSDWEIGAELSGGLDSSSIVALANRKLKRAGRSIHTFSNVMEKADIGRIPPYFDERGAIEEVIDFLGLEKTHLLSLKGENPELLKQESILLTGQPPEAGHFGMLSLPMLKMASSLNIRTVLSGHGGDEVVTCYGGGYTQELIRQFKLVTYFNHLKDKATIKKQSVAKWAIGQFTRDLFPYLFWLIYDKRHQVRLRDFGYLDYINEDIRRIMGIDLYAQNDRKWRAMDKSVRARQLNRAQNLHLSSRAERSAVLAKHYGIAYHYPMLDVDLMQFCISVPSHIKVSKGWGRYLFRASMRGILPETLRMQVQKPPTSITPSDYRMYLDHTSKANEIAKEIAGKYRTYFNTEKLKEESLEDGASVKIYDTIEWLEKWSESHEIKYD